MQLTAGAGGTASSGRIMRRVWWVLVGWLVAGWVLVAAAVPAGAAVDGALTRYPYLTDSVQTSITVNWATTTAQDTGSVRFGPEGACTASSKPASKTQITVNGLPEYQWKATIPVTPDTRYCYRVRLGATDLLGSDAAPVFTSQVAAGSSAPFSFAVFGDWGQAYATAPGQPNANPDQANVLSQIARSGARFAVMTGDTAYPNGSQTNYGDLQQTGPDISAVFGPDFWGIPGRSIPVFNVTGNHGFSSGNTQKVVWPETNVTSSSGGTYEMEDYPAMADAGTIAGRYPSFWYAFDAGPARFYVLTAAWADGNGGTNGVYAADAAAHWTPGQAEYEWLKHDLQTHPGGLKLAFWHYPLYADTPGARSDNSLQGGPGTLQGLLDANHVNLAFNGHAHGYERNAADPAGLISYVIGNGGADLGPVGSCSPFDLYAIGKNATHCGLGPAGLTDDHVFGFAKVTIDGQHITVTPTDELGRTYDIQTYTFTPGGPGSPPPPGLPGKGASACAATTRGGRRADHLVGSRRGDRLLGMGGNDVLEGMGGDDCLRGMSGRDVLRGGRGTDRLVGGGGHDRIFGGRGADRLDGGTGRDRLDGGRSRDVLRGGAGRDVIDARDGVRDRVDCGRGRDTARVDKHDRIRSCERVLRPHRARRGAAGRSVTGAATRFSRR
jgi:Ca2+-binding RTX toxin-like protein